MDDIHLSANNDFKFSVSALNTYLRCPRRFFFAFLLKLPAPEGSGAAIGLIVHRALERLHVWAGQQPVRPVYEEAHARLKIILPAIWQDIAAQFEYPAVEQAYYKKAFRMLDNYAALEFRKMGKDVPIRTTTEVKFDFRLGNFDFTGRVDRVDTFGDSSVAIIDYKTGKDDDGSNALIKTFYNLENRPGWRPSDYQLPLYYFYWQETSGKTPAWVGHYQLRRKGGPQLVKIEVLPGEPDEISGKPSRRKHLYAAEMEQVRQQILALLVEMDNTEEFIPRPHSPRECEICPFTFACDGPEKDDEE